MSRGSKTIVAKIIGVGLLTRSESAIIAAPDAHLAHFDFGDDDVECARLSFSDLVDVLRRNARKKQGE